MKKLISLLIILLLIPSALALEYTQRCLNSTHLETTVEFEICEESNCTDWSTAQVSNCTSGICSGNTCVQYFPKTSESYPWVILGIIAIAGVFAYIAVTVKDEYGLLKALFLSFALGIMLIAISVIQQFAVDSGLSSNTISLINTGYSTVLWSLYIFIIYFVLVLLMTLLGHVGKLPKLFKRGRWGKK